MPILDGHGCFLPTLAINPRHNLGSCLEFSPGQVEEALESPKALLISTKNQNQWHDDEGAMGRP